MAMTTDRLTAYAVPVAVSLAGALDILAVLLALVLRR